MLLSVNFFQSLRDVDLNNNDPDVPTTNDHDYALKPRENAGRNVNGRDDYVLKVDASEENAERNTVDDHNAYDWESPRGNNNFHKNHVRAENGYISPYQKGVCLTAPRSTHGFHDEDVILAGNLHHQKSKPVAQVIKKTRSTVSILVAVGHMINCT